jgi:uncharacterized protein YukJ
MPIQNYGVLKGRVYERIRATSKSEHFQILVNRGDNPHRIAINTKSAEPPSEVLFYANEDFKHPITDAIQQADLAVGFTPLPSNPSSIALDFIRSNLFDVSEMVPLPSNASGNNDDLNDRLDFFIQLAIKDESAVIYAFGQHWEDQHGADQYFHEINPSTGIHDIHMNQGNPKGNYFADNGIYQDGGIIIHYPSRDRWAAVFTAFQSQSFHTDDQTGNPISDPGQQELVTPVCIIAAMVNPETEDPGHEYIILLNKSNKPIDLTNWQIVDKLNKRDVIGSLVAPAGDTLRIMLTGNGAQLSNKGGSITLLNEKGLKIDGATYTKADASKEGEVIEL